MDITAVAFSPDGQTLATGGSDRLVKLWDLANGHEKLTLTGHPDQVRVLAFSPDGKTLASAGGSSGNPGDENAEIRIWSVADGKQTRLVTGPGQYVMSLAYSSDGKYLVSGHAGKQGGAAGIVAMHDAATGELKRQISDFRVRVSSVAFNSTGKILGVGVEDGTVRLYKFADIVDSATPTEYWSQQDNEGATYQVSFTPDDRKLICCGGYGIKIYVMPQPDQAFQPSTPERTIPISAAGNHFKLALAAADSKALITGAVDGILRIYDMETGQTLTSLPGHSGEIRSLALHPFGSQIASAGSDSMVRLWDFDVVVQTRDLTGHDGPVWFANFDSEGRRAVSASGDGTARIWDAHSAETLLVLKHGSPVTMALFTPDGKRTITAGADRKIKVWDAESGKMLDELTGHTGTVTALDISPDGRHLLSAGADHLVKLWELAPGGVKEIGHVDGIASVVAAVAFHPDGKQFAVGCVDQMIYLCDLAGKIQTRWPAHAVAVSSLSFSPDGKLLASSGADGIVRVWPLATPGQRSTAIAGHNGPVSGVAFRKDNQHLLTSGADLLIKLWKLEGEGAKELQNYRGHRDWVTSANFSRDGTYVVSSSVDRTVKIWEITSRDLPFLPEHTGSVDTIAFSPDGTKIISGGADKTIKIWDRATGKELGTMKGHTSQISGLAPSPDGKMLFSSGFDRSIRVWDLAAIKEIPKSPSQQANWAGMLASPLLLSMTPDGKTLNAWVPADDRSTYISSFDLEGNDRGQIIDQGRKVHSLCFSPDGRRSAAGSDNGVVRVWDLDKRTTIPASGGDWQFFDKAKVADLALTPDGSKIVVTSEKGDITIAQVEGRKIEKEFKGHADKINGCIVSPDGKRFATWDASNVVKLWDLTSGEELRHWDLGSVDRSNSVLSFAFSPDGRNMAIGNSNTTIFLLEVP
jgi:WD40 repeat protein